MSLANHVSLQITTDTLGITRAAFGVPMYLSHSASFAERLRFYEDISGLVSDGFATTSPEYLWAQKVLSQSPHPEKVAIGRAANTPTQVYTIVVSDVRNSHTYSVTVKGEGVTATTATFTSDANATANEIATGLQTALNNVTGKNFTATLSTDDVVVTGDAAGDWFSLEIDPADLSISQTHSDPGVAADLTAILNENSGWYTLETGFNSNAYVLAAAAWAETNKRLYFACVNETEAINTAAGNSDTLDDLATAGYKYSVPCYHQEPAAFFAGAWQGAVLWRDAGTETWKFKRPTGVVATTLTTTQRTNLVDRRANFLQSVGNINITQEGTTAESGGFIDVRRFLDWLEDDLSKEVLEVIAGAAKVPYTDEGVALVEAAVRASLQRGVQRGGIAADPAFVVTVPLVANVSASNKSNRLLPDMKFSFTLAGAVHEVTVIGVVSV